MLIIVPLLGLDLLLRPSRKGPSKAALQGAVLLYSCLVLPMQECYNKRGATHPTVDVVADIFAELARNEGSLRERL